MSNWIATPQGAYIAEDGGYLMCVQQCAASQAYAYDTVCRDGTYHRGGAGYPDAKNAMVAAEKTMREHRNIRLGIERVDVIEQLKKERDEALAEAERRRDNSAWAMKERDQALKERDTAVADINHMRLRLHQAQRELDDARSALRHAQADHPGPTWDVHRETVERLKKELSKVVDDAWAATGVASTVRGLTDLADVIETIRKERDEWRGLAQNHAARLASVRKALQNEQP